MSEINGMESWEVAVNIRGIHLTPREAQVYAALSTTPEWPHQIAQRAGLRSMSMGEAGARYCISLTKKGLAEKHGTRTSPKWARKATATPTDQEEELHA